MTVPSAGRAANQYKPVPTLNENLIAHLVRNVAARLAHQKHAKRMAIFRILWGRSLIRGYRATSPGLNYEKLIKLLDQRTLDAGAPRHVLLHECQRRGERLKPPSERTGGSGTSHRSAPTHGPTEHTAAPGDVSGL